MSVTTAAPRGGTRVHVQKFGTFLSNMIMPNIGAIIAWGLLTALFIPDGWTPNEKIATLVGPSIFYLLPILIAYTGGKIVYGVRGGVVGAVGVMGVILATSDPAFIGERGQCRTHVPRRHDHGAVDGVGDEEGRRALGRQDQARVRDARRQLRRRHPGSGDGDRRHVPARAASCVR